MGGKLIKPLCFVILTIIISSTACSTANTGATQTPPPPVATHTPTPSYTPYPTYTPLPTRTKSPTATSTPSPTKFTDSSPTAPGPAVPTNCVASKMPGYFNCFDDTGSIFVDVPVDWTDINGSSWEFNGLVIGVAISASSSLANYHQQSNVEGMFFGASETFAKSYGYIEILDPYAEPYQRDCHWVDRYEYNDGVYRGKYDIYTDCLGAPGMSTYLLGAVDIVDPSSKIILVEITINSSDIEIKDQIWSTFYVFF